MIAVQMSSIVSSRYKALIVSRSIFTFRKHPFGVKTSSIYFEISPSLVISIRPFTILALGSTVLLIRDAVMIGVLMFATALMISRTQGTPRVMFIEATPAKWNVFRVIYVPGSPIDCAAIAPTHSPGEIKDF